MKPPILILSLIIIVLVTFMTLNFIEDRKEDRVLQVEIDFLKAKNLQEKDLFEKIVKLKDDTIRIAKHTIILQADTIKNQELDKQNYKRNTHDKIRFIGFTTDAKRDSMVAILYPSLRHR